MVTSLSRSGALKVGLLYSESGVTAEVEKTQRNATILAIEELNEAGGVNGRPIRAVAYDPASTPKQYAALAERLLDVDRVRLIFGCYMSSTRKAVLPVIEAYRGLLFYATPYEGFEYSPHCIYTGSAPNQNSKPLARFLLAKYGQRMMFVGSNYVYPYESNRIMADLVMHAGGSILDEIYVPLDATAHDFDRVIARIASAKPDVVFSTVVGRATAVFYEIFAKAGFDAARMPIASLTTSEAEIAEMSHQAAHGHITAAPFFDVVSSAAATAFVARYKARFGQQEPVTAVAEAAYFQMMLAARGIDRAGTDEPERVREALTHIEFDAPQGRVRIDPRTNHTYLWPRIARVNDKGRFEILWESGKWIKPDPYRVTDDEDDWLEQSPTSASSDPVVA